MRFDKRIILHYFTGLLAASALFLSVSSCSRSRSGLAQPPGGLSVETAAEPVINDPGPYLPALKLAGSPDVSVESRERLVKLREENPGTIRAARASFLLGLLAVEEGGAGALAYLDTAAGLKDIPDYLAFYRARAHALEKDYKKAVSAFDSLIKDYPGSALVPEAFYHRSIALLKDGRAEEARDGMMAFVSAYPDNRLAPEALLKSAEASVLLGQFNEAAAAARKILTDFPASLAANGAEALFREIAAGEGKAPDFTPAERYRRARRLFNNARFKEAVSEFSALAAEPSGEFHDRAMINSIVSKVRLKDYAGANRITSAYLDGSRTPPKEHELGALYWSALVSLRQGSESGLRKAAERLSARYPLSIERARALLFLARHYASRKMAPEAIETYKKVIDGFNGTASAEEAAWSTGWLYYRSDRFEDAFKVFSVYPASGAELPRFLYWAGRSAENMGGIDEAARRYRLLCAAYEADYYCRMAEKRLGSLDPAFSLATASSMGVTKPSVEAGKLPLEGSAAGIFTDPHYLAARELMTLGLGERAATEITMLMKAHSGEPGALVELAGLFYQAEDFYSAFRVYNSYLSRLASNGAANPFDLSTLSFPPRLVELARRKSPPGSVDPYLIAAVIREESAFNPDAVSTTGALGLMQIMPSTGRYIAGKLGEDLNDARELLDPDTNIKLGSWYLGHLARRFEGDIVLTIASYNAGPNAVQRWTETLPTELDEFIESIPYPETRNYAKKVLKSYGEFLRTGGADPSGLLTRPALVLELEEGPAHGAGAEAEAVADDEKS